MNTFITLACLLAVAASGHASGLYNGYGLGGYGLGLGGYGLGLPVYEKIIKVPIYAPAVSTQNVIKAAPIPVIKSVAVAPIIAEPVIKAIPVASYGLGGLGYGGYGLGKGLGYGLGYDGYGLKGLGYGKYV